MTNRPTYEEACAFATTRQGLDPIVAAIAAAGIPVTVNQTGGFCMCVRVEHPTAAASVWVTVDQGDYNDARYGDDDDWQPAPDTFLACVYPDDEDGGEGATLTEAATIPETVAAIIRWRDCPTGLTGSPAPDYGRIIAHYEQVARGNRADDWPDFLEEAREDPASIWYEMTDTASDLGIALTTDEADHLHDLALAWLERQ
ncbi:MAG: hypothetical protein FJW95_16905 [Actinobacteria bacterium]|nr:hypothetical protein [Actinomycetota bacterium]